MVVVFILIKADFQFALIIPSAVLGPGLKIIIFNDYSGDEDLSSTNDHYPRRGLKDASGQ